MKAKLTKENLQKVIRAINRINSQPQKVFLNVGDNQLDVIVNAVSFLRLTIPAEDTEPGMVSINGKLFSNLLNLRSNTITIQKHNNALRVKGGSVLELYCNDMFKDEISIPKVDTEKVVKLDSKSTAEFKTIMSRLIFQPTESTDIGTPVNLVNNSKGFTISMADSIHCAFYTTKSISPTEFDITTDLTSIQQVFSFIEDKTSLVIGSSFILVKSSTLVTTIPLLQVGGEYIKTAKTFLEDKNYKKGVLKFTPDKVEEVLSSISTISSGVEILSIAVKDKITFKLETVHGKSVDRCEYEHNDLGVFSIEVPSRLFENVLSSSSIGQLIEFKLNVDDRYYKLETTNKDLKVQCIGPISSVS